jgi:hypothetical protein
MRLPALCLLFTLSVAAQDPVDLGVVDRIKAESFDRSKVMDHLYYLTEVHGPRLTGSPQFERAANWAMERLKGYGVVNVHAEKWPFGRAWSVEQATVEMIEPHYQAMSAVPLAWTGSTNGAVTGDLVIAVFQSAFQKGPKKALEDLAAYQAKWSGKLRGKIVLISALKPPKPQVKEQFHRYTDADLANMAKAPDPSVKSTVQKVEELEWPEDPEEIGKLFASLPNALMEQLYELSDERAAKLAAFFAKEGVAAVLKTDGRAHQGMVFAEAAGSYKNSSTLAPPAFVITTEQYDRLARAVEKKQPVKVRVNLKTVTPDRAVEGWNLVGEIPGGAKKDEVVMIGAHFDSWHGGTGTTDNGTGSAVMIEVMRVLKALNLKLDRTVRIGLWGGEEQGLLGSRAYVKEHFGSGTSNVSGYFNLDNGSGKIRGVYLQGNDAMRPLFEQWLAPFKDQGVTTVSIRNTGGTDHLSFDAAGIPGFQFIQDPLDYGTITHHSNMDTYDHAVAEDLMQASAVIASCVYQAANRNEMLPRRPK